RGGGRGGGDGEWLPAAGAARQIRLTHLTIASRISDRVALEQHDQTMGPGGATEGDGRDARGGERRGGGNEITTGQRRGHWAARQSTMKSGPPPAARALRPAPGPAIMRTRLPP